MMNESQQSAEPANKPMEPSVIDLEGSLRRLGGDTSLFQEFIEFFEDDAPQLRRELQEAVQRGDIPSVQRAAHSIKGLAANFGAVECAAAAAEIENRAKAGSFPTAGDLKALDIAMARLENALRELKTN